ncbi:hypothetical protein [Streptomyces zaomyceticus]|uniref:hypothetical protein n=1 Tax=Streptomyces zaomyceticus TaxID=68286 RepID=UPI002E166CC6|nr:hypothetical protein OG237_06295 [Streptomyces zaomyceticus]
MTDTITLDMGAGSTLTVPAYETDTDGLIIHGLGPFSSELHLVHTSGFLIGVFARFGDAQAAAKELAGVIDWTCTAETLRAVDDSAIWTVIDKVEAVGGEFRAARGGRGEAIAKARLQAKQTQAAA